LKVGNNPTTIDASSVLEAESTTKGFLPPRMTTAQRDAIAAPAKGLVLYNTTLDCLQINKGTAAVPTWECIGASFAPTAVTVSNNVLAQIGNEGDAPDIVNSVVTATQLGQIVPTITGVTSANETAYQDYIDANPNAFSSPATASEIQTMVTAVNNNRYF